jgi:hypothetical protein
MIRRGGDMVTPFEVVLRRRQRKQNTPIRVELHPSFGNVQVFVDRWEASVLGSPFREPVDIAGGGAATGPTTAQARLFAHVQGQYPLLFGLALEALSEEFSAVRPPLRDEDLRIMNVYLDDGEPPSFTFNFVVPSRFAEMPYGLYADFVNFQVEEAGWVH